MTKEQLKLLLTEENFPDEVTSVTIVNRFWHYVMPQYKTLEEFASVDDKNILRAYGLQLKSEGSDKKPFIGSKLYSVVHLAQKLIKKDAFEERKREQAELAAKEKAAKEEAERNPIFDVSALETVVTLAKLSDRTKVDLKKIILVCEAFGIDIGERPTKTLTSNGNVISVKQ